MRRTGSGVLCAGLLALSVWALGCASGPVQLYEGAPLPAGEVVVLTEQSSKAARIIGIDDRRAHGSEFHLAPGDHVVWSHVRTRKSAHDYSYTVWSYCRFKFEAAPGSRWELTSSSETIDETVQNKRINVDVILLETQTRNVVHLRGCMSSRPDL